jgi:hypothetical protein
VGHQEGAEPTFTGVRSSLNRSQRGRERHESHSGLVRRPPDRGGGTFAPHWWTPTRPSSHVHAQQPKYFPLVGCVVGHLLHSPIKWHKPL